MGWYAPERQHPSTVIPTLEGLERVSALLQEQKHGARSVLQLAWRAHLACFQKPLRSCPLIFRSHAVVRRYVPPIEALHKLRMEQGCWILHVRSNDEPGPGPAPILSQQQDAQPVSDSTVPQLPRIQDLAIAGVSACTKGMGTAALTNQGPTSILM